MMPGYVARRLETYPEPVHDLTGKCEIEFP